MQHNRLFRTNPYNIKYIVAIRAIQDTKYRNFYNFNDYKLYDKLIFQKQLLKIYL